VEKTFRGAKMFGFLEVVLIIAFVALIVDIVGALFLLKFAKGSPSWIHEIVEEWRSGTLLDNLIKKNEEGEIIMDERLVMAIDAVGSRMAQSAKMSLLQGMGAQAKIEKGLQGAIASDIVENKMPIINLLGEFMGFNVKQYISKHPQALGQLLQMAGPYLKQLNLGNNGAIGTIGPNQGQM